MRACIEAAMSDIYHLLNRELQELQLAKYAKSRRVRDIHLTLAIAYVERAISQMRPPEVWFVGHV